MPVTAGSISIARRINTGDYSHKEAKVELHYVAEGNEKIGDLGDIARIEALAQLSTILATIVKIENAPVFVVDDTVTEKLEPKPGEVTEPVKRHRRTKAEMETARVAGMDASLEAASAASGDPLPAIPPLLAAMEGPSAKTAMDEAIEITDKELNNECNATMLRIKNKTRIQAVIGEHTQGAVSTIPQSARAAFMQKLQTLQP